MSAPNQVFEGDNVAPARKDGTTPRANGAYYNITADDWASGDLSRSDTAHECAALVCYSAYCNANFADYALNRKETFEFCRTYWHRQGPFSHPGPSHYQKHDHPIGNTT